MRVVFATHGTWGDIQPILHLAGGFRQRGDDTVVSTPPDFEARVRAGGHTFVPVPLASREWMQEHAAALTSPWRLARAMLRTAERDLLLQLDTLVEVARGADLVIGGGVMLAGHTAAEAAGVPYRYLVLAPQMFPSGHHPPMTLPWPALPPLLCKAAWRLFGAFNDRAFRPILAPARRRLGLPEPGNLERHFLSDHPIVAVDEAVARVPPDVGLPYRQTASIVPQGRGEELPEPVRAFLAAGPPPAYVGFGSMTDPDPAHTTATIVAAARAAGLRLLLGRGWAGLGGDATGDDVLVVGETDHGALFQEVAVVVHHGGASTVAACVRAGVPQVVVPHLLDQFYWRHTVARSGLGVAGPTRRRMGVRSLARAMSLAAGEPALRARAAEVSRGLVPLDEAVATTRDALLASL